MQINILGSCVTRDAFNFHKFPDLQLKYVARQSIISFCSPAPAQKIVDDIIFAEDLPNFEKTMARLDLSKAYADVLNQNAPLVVDLIEERFFILKYINTYFTNSTGMKKSNIEDKKVRQISSFTPVRLNLTMQFIDRYIEKISAFKKVILHRAFYDNNYANYVINIKYANEYLDTLYTYITDKNPSIQSIDIPDEFKKANPSHRWGPAPFHFVDEYYIYFMKKLCEYLDLEFDKNDFTLSTEN